MESQPVDGRGSLEELRAENELLRQRLRETEETLRAIGNGEVDAFVVSGSEGDHIFTLKGAEQPYRILVEAMSEGAANLAEDGTVLYCNSRLAAMLGQPLEKLIGAQFAAFVAPECRQAFIARIGSRPLESEREEMLLLHGSETIQVLFSCGALDPAEAPGIGVLFTDISELKKTQQELREEKTLLVELLHRVKNTLVQISSLASIEAELSELPEVKLALEELGGRISALSNLYVMLHNSGDLGSVRLDLYLGEIARAVVTAIRATRGWVGLRLELDPLTVHPRQASPLGLALNELITNAFKYAFKDGGSGELVLALKDRGDSILMEVSNDGIRLPEDFDPQRSKGLGLALVKSLAVQLGGSFAWERGEWTKFSVCFPKGQA